MGCLEDLLTNPHVLTGIGVTLASAALNTMAFYAMTKNIGMGGAGYGKKYYLGALMAAMGFAIPTVFPIIVMSQNLGIAAADLYGFFLSLPMFYAASRRYADIKPKMRTREEWRDVRELPASKGF